MRNTIHKRKLYRLGPIGLGVCVTGTLIGNSPNTFGQAATEGAARMERLEKENQELRARMQSLEELAQKQGLVPSGTAPKLVSALSEISLSGFVQASYFYDTSTPGDRVSNAYLWNATHNSFSLNKVKLTLASPPVERSGTDWDAGFRTSFIFGEDAPNVNTGGELQSFEGLREAYVELNVPLGSGLNVKAGQLISLLNWESGDGGAANPNFSQGNQWWFTGNGPAAGVQLGYAFTEVVDLKVRVQNGLFAGPVDSNDGKAVLASLGFKPNKKLWANLIGWYSEENQASDVSGGSIIGGYQATEKLGTGFEFDYFNFDPRVGSSADLWSVGGWVWYDFSPKFGIAFRGDYINSPDFVLGPPMRGPASAIVTPDTDGDLASLTLTFNFRPTPSIKIQPELRYDHTSYKDGFDGKQDRFIVGAGISYLY